MKKLFWGLFSVFLCLAFISPASALVWEVGEGANGHDFKIFYFGEDENKSWESARSALEGTGYTLAAITTVEEQEFIQDFLNKEYFSGMKDLWIGGKQDPKEALPNESWSWVTGEKWDYESWIAGEANDHYDGRNGYDPINSEMFLSVRSGSNWNWNDEGNLNNISGYLAETAPVPEPGTLMLMGLGLVGLAGVGRKKFKR